MSNRHEPQPALDELVRLIVLGDDLPARQLAAKVMAQPSHFSDILRPQFSGALERALSCALVEWFASQRGESPPRWALEDAEVLSEPYFLFGDPKRFPRFYRRCVSKSPPPFKRRNLIASADYMLMV